MRNIINTFENVIPSNGKSGGAFILPRAINVLACSMRPTRGAVRSSHTETPIQGIERNTQKAYIKQELEKINKTGFVIKGERLDKWVKGLWSDRREMKNTKSGFGYLLNPHWMETTWKRAGIYMITNTITKKKYIGKSINLYERFTNYGSDFYLEREQSSMINRAILKFGRKNFKVDIIENCKESDLSRREQYYITVMKPQLNIRKSTCKTKE